MGLTGAPVVPLTDEQLAASLAAQEAGETKLALDHLVGDKPATDVGLDASEWAKSTGALGLSDPGSADIGAAGAAEARKAAGQAGVAPSRGASQKAWVDYAVSSGADRDVVVDLSRAELIEQFGTAEPQPAQPDTNGQGSEANGQGGTMRDDLAAFSDDQLASIAGERSAVVVYHDDGSVNRDATIDSILTAAGYTPAPSTGNQPS